ncbi:MAG: PKD domain-containing protein, partial [Thermoplasmata archaeon]
EESLSVSISSIPVSDPDGDEITCIWDYGDDSKADVKMEGIERWYSTHTYSAAGTYEVSLTLDDGRGGMTEIVKNITVGTTEEEVETAPPTSIGMSETEKESSVDLGLILQVLIIVIVVIVIAALLYLRAGKKYEEEEEEEEEDLLEGDMGISELLGLSVGGPMQQAGMGVPGAPGMYGQYTGYPMHRGAFFYPQSPMVMGAPGLPPMGTVFGPQVMPSQPPPMAPQLMLPPAQEPEPLNLCPQCNQQTIEFLTPDGSSFHCTSCGYKV